MSFAKIAITLEKNLLARVDFLVKAHFFPNRSKAIATAVAEKLSRIDQTRLARECSKLNPSFEQAMAEEGLGEDISEWPAY